MFTELVKLQPFASVTVTEYTPAAKPPADVNVDPPGVHK